MKKLIILSLVSLFMLTGCGPEKGDTILGSNFIIKSKTVQSLFGADLYVLVDKSSGVNYYYVHAGYGKALSPIYDKDGKIVVDKIQ